MNFNITKLKIQAVLFFSSVYAFYATSFYGGYYCMDCSISKNRQEGISIFIFNFITAFILVYIIWSFFDKKESSIMGKIIITVFLLVALLIFMNTSAYNYILQLFLT